MPVIGYKESKDDDDDDDIVQVINLRRMKWAGHEFEIVHCEVMECDLVISCFFLVDLKSYHHILGIFKNISTIYIKKTKLRGLSPRANYTDRAAAAGRRS
jgi:hypothetical protein